MYLSLLTIPIGKHKLRAMVMLTVVSAAPRPLSRTQQILNKHFPTGWVSSGPRAEAATCPWRQMWLSREFLLTSSAKAEEFQWENSESCGSGPPSWGLSRGLCPRHKEPHGCVQTFKHTHTSDVHYRRGGDPKTKITSKRKTSPPFLSCTNLLPVTASF